MSAGADRGLLRVYRALLSLYPRGFRTEYGDDMVQLVREACHAEPSARVACRVLVDLAISVPTQHLEVRMHRRPSLLIPLMFTAVSAAGILLAVVGGTNVPLLVVGLVVAAIAGTLAVAAWRRAAPLGGSVRTTHWWKLVVAGPAIIGGVVVAAELGVDAWYVGMCLVFVALVLTATGLVLGVTRLTTRRPPAIGS